MSCPHYGFVTMLSADEVMKCLIDNPKVYVPMMAHVLTDNHISWIAENKPELLKKVFK